VIDALLYNQIEIASSLRFLATTTLRNSARKPRDAGTLLYLVIASDQRERGNLSGLPADAETGF
jgi:hypothetical protein